MKSPITVMEKALGPTGTNLTSLLGEGVFGFGIGVGLGELYVRHQDKFIGRNAPWIATAFGKGIAALITVFTGGHGGPWATPVGGLFNMIGQSGATATGLEVGLDHARKSAGVLPPPKTAVGALPPAAAGRALTFQQLEEIAQMS